MRTDSLFDEDATSFASTIGRANTSPSGVTTITLEFTIPGATSLRCTPDQGTSSAPDNLFGGESKSSAPLDPWAPKDSMGGRSSPQINPWKGLVRGPASAVPVVIEGTGFILEENSEGDVLGHYQVLEGSGAYLLVGGTIGG